MRDNANTTSSLRRDAWRIELFQEQIAFEAAARRNAQQLRRALVLGAIGGLAIAVSNLLIGFS